MDFRILERLEPGTDNRETRQKLSRQFVPLVFSMTFFTSRFFAPREGGACILERELHQLATSPPVGCRRRREIDISLWTRSES